MSRFFNTAGPTKPDKHYSIDPLHRVDWDEVRSLIDQERYFVLHAPRQTGKTSTLLAIMEALNAAGRYRALYANIEAAQASRGHVAAGIAAICSAVARAEGVYLQSESMAQWLKAGGNDVPAEDRFSAMLAHWAQHADRPVVLLLDEVDALVGDTLISLLRQIRAGYAQRPEAFPQSLVLCGVRDVRDYRLHQGGGEVITGGSAFNIKSKSLRLGNFSPEEVRALYLQHTAETGQTFEESIFGPLWDDTWGQPWLVNALGHEMTWEDKSARDRQRPITWEHYRAARERLIQGRATHLDQLSDKLREPRVHAVVSALLESDSVEPQFRDDDLQYVSDLGLIRTRPQLAIANRIYQEVIPRELTWTTQVLITHPTQWYVREDRRLDMPKLLAAFQQFFREHGDSWIQQFAYREAGPQLLMQAFLQRIVNGGGRVNREYGLGLRRTDLLVEWPLDPAQGYFGPVQRVVIELKLLRRSLEATLAEALPQTADYADRCGAEEAHLIVFDRRPETSWDARIWRRRETAQPSGAVQGREGHQTQAVTEAREVVLAPEALSAGAVVEGQPSDQGRTSLPVREPDCGPESRWGWVIDVWGC